MKFWFLIQTNFTFSQLNTLGLLPTHASDWVSSLPPPQVGDFFLTQNHVSMYFNSSSLSWTHHVSCISFFFCRRLNTLAEDLLSTDEHVSL